MPECRLLYPAQLLLIIIFWVLALDEPFVTNDLFGEISSLFHSLQTFSAKWWRHSKMFVMFIGPGECFSPQAWDYGLVVLWGASAQYRLMILDASPLNHPIWTDRSWHWYSAGKGPNHSEILPLKGYLGCSCKITNGFWKFIPVSIHYMSLLTSVTWQIL